MTIQRQNIVRGPAIVTMGGQSFYSKEDIKITYDVETFPITSSIFGKSTERVSDLMARISFTPVGQWTTNLLAQMYPHTNPTIGASLFGSTDTPVAVWPISGTERITFTSGAVTKMPGLIMSATETSFKEMEITCVLKNNAARSAVDALYTIANATFTDNTFNLAQIMTVPYTVSLASLTSPWNSIMTEAGVEIDFDFQTAPVKVNSLGTVDMSVAGLDISVKMKPLGMSVADVLTRLRIQGAGTAIGGDLSASGNNLTCTGGSGNPQVVINNVRLKAAGGVYGNQALRHDTIEFIATRPAGGAMFTIGLA